MKALLVPGLVLAVACGKPGVRPAQAMRRKRQQVMDSCGEHTRNG